MIINKILSRTRVTSALRIEFPTSFKWGVSESGFQFEMGDQYRRFIDANTDWWHWVRDPNNISSKLVSGDLPEEGINYIELYRIDHKIAHSLGLNIYRLGIEWSRIFPYPTYFIDVDVLYDGNGYPKEVKIDKDILQELDKIADPEAVDLYRKIILDLRSAGFKVIVNLFHFTLPYWLHNPILARKSNLIRGPLGIIQDNFPIEFAKYAAYVAWKLGDIIDLWSTMNEPMVPVELGYMGSYTGFPPGVMAIDKVPKALANLALAHSLAYDLIKKFDTAKADPDSREPAEVGIIYNFIPAYHIRTKDEIAAEHYSYFHNKLLLNAIVHGRLDINLDEETILKPSVMGNKLDWIGVNYYTRIVVRREEHRFNPFKILDFDAVPGYGYACVPYGISKIGRWCDGMGWEHYPEGLYRALEIAKEYSNIIYITENGTSDSRDVLRPAYIVNHLYVLYRAMESGLDIKGYMHWALTDNYEWAQGFRQKFGLYKVDLITKERIPRPSSKIFGEIVQSNSIPSNYLKYLIKMESDRYENDSS